MSDNKEVVTLEETEQVAFFHKLSDDVEGAGACADSKECDKMSVSQLFQYLSLHQELPVIERL